MIAFVIVLFLTEIHQTVFIFEEVLFISSSLNTVCMTPASLFLIHTPASNRASLCFILLPLSQRGFAVGTCSQECRPPVLQDAEVVWGTLISVGAGCHPHL